MVQSAHPAQRTLRDLASNGLSVTARLAAGVLLFVFIGRQLGPSAFGEFVFASAVAGLLAYLSGLGFSQQALRDIPAQPALADRLSDRLLSLRALLALPVLLLPSLAACWWGDWFGVLAWMTLALVCDGTQEYLFVLLKARGRFDLEARFVSVASLLHCLLVGAVAWQHPSVEAVALAFAVSRMLQLLAAALMLRGSMRLPNLVWEDGLIATLRANGAYALDVGLSTLASQFDTILVRLLFGATTAGLYQAAMRVVLGLQTFSVVAGNVFVPRLASALREPSRFAVALAQLRRTYGLLALAGGFAVAALGWVLTRYGYGPEYLALMPLWPLCALLFALRMWAARYGVSLTALGDQRFRTLVNVGNVLIAAGLMGLLTAVSTGLAAALVALLGAAVFVLALYGVRARRLEQAL